MGNLLLKTALLERVPKIELPIDDELKKESYGVQSIVQHWGRYFPVVQINDYVLPQGSIQDCNVSIMHGDMARFSLTITDHEYRVRRSLKKSDFDTLILFMGGENWYIKFQGVIHNAPEVSTQSGFIYLYGSIYIPKLYDNMQKSYKGQSVENIFKDICQNTEIGLYVCANDTLSNTHPFIINPNLKNIDFLRWLIGNYTDCLWAIDTNYYMYLCAIESTRAGSVDTYKIFNDKVLDEAPIIITNNNLEEKERKIGIQSYTVTSGNALREFTTPLKKYNFFKTINEQISSPITHKEQQQMGRVVVVELIAEHNLYEITPFSVVDLQLYLPQLAEDKNYNKPPEIDKELSGKKVCIGIEYNYTNTINNDVYGQRVRQKLFLL